MQLIGAGFGRTGTYSLKVALERLGIGHCYHMAELFAQPERAPLWQAAGRGEIVDWNSILQGYGATVDWPGAVFYRELMQAFPNAPVILTVRDPESWYQSVRNTIYRSPERRRSAENEGREAVARANRAIIWHGTFGDEFDDKRRAITTFNRHIEEVRDTVPHDQLLVYNIREGWEPLCRLLGVDAPRDVSFPHLNDTRSYGGSGRDR